METTEKKNVMKRMRPLERMLAAVTLLVVVAVSLCSCVHPGGDIGPYFGNWGLEKIEIDGEVNDDYSQENPVFLSFQSSVFNMGTVGSWGTFGMWEEEEGILTLTADSFAAPDRYFPRIMGWGSRISVSLTILEKSSRRLRLQWDDPDGRLWVYTFKKLL